MSKIEHNDSLRRELQQRLDQFDRTENPTSNLTSAAVVIGVSALAKSTSASILLTRRSSKLRKHSGQFALPGGKVDSGESIVSAALRELREELGLSQTKNEILGFLDDMPTQSGFNITPVVVWINDLTTLKPNPDEVAAVYQIPLTELESLELNLSQEDPGQDTGQDMGADSENLCTNAENDVMSVYLPSVGTTVYSPTAAMIYQFREVALLGRTTRVAHFGQPRFAWR